MQSPFHCIYYYWSTVTVAVWKTVLHAISAIGSRIKSAKNPCSTYSTLHKIHRTKYHSMSWARELYEMIHTTPEQLSMTMQDGLKHNPKIRKCWSISTPPQLWISIGWSIINGKHNSWIAQLQSGSENKLLIMRYWERGMLNLGRSSNSSSSVPVISSTGFTGEAFEELDYLFS